LREPWRGTRNYKPLREIVQDPEALRKENRSLRDDLKQKSMVLERYENNLRDTAARRPSWRKALSA
jgi:hypothetical protein